MSLGHSSSSSTASPLNMLTPLCMDDVDVLRVEQPVSSCVELVEFNDGFLSKTTPWVLVVARGLGAPCSIEGLLDDFGASLSEEDFLDVARDSGPSCFVEDSSVVEIERRRGIGTAHCGGSTVFGSARGSAGLPLLALPRRSSCAAEAMLCITSRVLTDPKPVWANPIWANAVPPLVAGAGGAGGSDSCAGA